MKSPNKRTKPVVGEFMKAVCDLSHFASRSITFDHGGTEFVSWSHLQAEIGIQTWFYFVAERNCGKHEATRSKMVAVMSRSASLLANIWLQATPIKIAKLKQTWGGTFFVPGARGMPEDIALATDTLSLSVNFPEEDLVA